MSNILGGFLGTLWHSSGYNDNSIATNLGIITRINPRLDPGNILARGTGERGLYNLLLGMRHPMLAIEFNPTTAAEIANYQNGQSAYSYLHLKWAGSTDGLTFVSPYVNRCSVESRHNEAVVCTMEYWAAGNPTYPSGLVQWNGSVPNQNWAARKTLPYKWLNSVLKLAGAIETQWWSWRYETVNNLQRLGNVATGGTRAVKARHRDVTGLVVKDLEDFDEWGTLANIIAEMAKFNITIELDSVDLLNCDFCRWGIIEAPTGPEDLIAKRFPFTATDLTTFTP